MKIIMPGILCAAIMFYTGHGFGALSRCGSCNLNGCECPAGTTNGYCCPANTNVPTCPTGWSLGGTLCNTCTRASTTTYDSATHRYTTTKYGSCSPTTTIEQCMQYTATDTCGKKLMCVASSVGIL